MGIFDKASSWLKGIGFNQYFPQEFKKTIGGIGSSIAGVDYSKLGSSISDSSFMQGINRRMKSPVGQTTSGNSLSDYLKKMNANQTYPSSYPQSYQTTPTPQYTPPPYSSGYNQQDSTLKAMEDRTAKRVGDAPAQAKTTSESPFIARPDPSKTTFSQKITKRGVFTVARDEFGGERETFLRENRPGDMAENELYTHNKEWRPLSTEQLQGRGELSFIPGQSVLQRLKNKIN